MSDMKKYEVTIYREVRETLCATIEVIEANTADEAEAKALLIDKSKLDFWPCDDTAYEDTAQAYLKKVKS